MKRKEYLKNYNKEYYPKNRADILRKKKEWYKKEKKETPKYRIIYTIPDIPEYDTGYLFYNLTHIARHTKIPYQTVYRMYKRGHPIIHIKKKERSEE